MITLIVFILILSILVLVHEFGHFIVAKKHGVRVEEFGLGLPPKVFGKKIGETLYSLNLLPFGGFVRLTGEDSTEVSDINDNRNFMSKKPFQRAQILGAGVFMNFLLAISLFYVFLIANGFKTLNMPLLFDYKFRFGNEKTLNTVIVSFLEDSAGLESDLQVGEAILEVDGKPVYSVADVRSEIKDKVGQEVKLLVIDLKRQANSDLRTVSIYPKADENGDGVLGTYMSKSVVLSYDTPVEKVFSGFMHSYNMLAYSGQTFASLISLSLKEKDVAPVSESVAGPVGIYSVVGGILNYSKDKVLLSLIDLTALMSLSLALLNVMPFPALDGGRMFFVLLEVIRRGKKISPTLEANIHKWGMILLLGLIVLITLKDIVRIAS